jgi:hypothetical protein
MVFAVVAVITVITILEILTVTAVVVVKLVTAITFITLQYSHSSENKTSLLIIINMNFQKIIKVHGKKFDNDVLHTGN